MRRLLSVTTITTVLTVGFVLVAIGTPLLGITVFASSDMMMTRAPWSYLVPTGFTPQNPYPGDTIDVVIPATHVFVERLWAGDFASWWSFSTGGAQLGSVPSYAFLSPVTWPWLVLPADLAPGYMKLVEMVVCIGGTFLFLRRLDLAKAAALLGGLVFVSSGFMIAWTNWQHTRVAAFVPALFWAVERLVTRRRPTDVALVAVVVACLLFGGFPAVTFMALVSAAVYGLVRALVEASGGPDGDREGEDSRDGRRRLSPAMAKVWSARWSSTRPELRDRGWGAARRVLAVVGLATAGVVLGVGVTAFQLLPFAQELGAIALANRVQSSDSHSPVESLVLAVAADAFGGTNPNVQPQGWFGLGHPVEEMAYLGAATMVLLVIGVVARLRPGMPRGARGYFVVAVLLTGVLIFLGGPLLGALQQLPVFSTNRIGRARSMLGFFVAVLAAVGFDALVRAPARRAWSAARRWLWWAWAAVAWLVALGLGLWVVVLARRYAFARDHLDYFEDSLTRAAVYGGVAVLAALVAWRARGFVKSLGLVVVQVLVVVQALTVVLPYWARVAPEYFYPPTSTHEFLAANVGSDRLVAAGSMMTGTQAYYGLRTVGGRGFIAEDYEDLLRDACPSCFISPTYVAAPYDPAAFDEDVLDRLGARYRVTDPAAPIPGNEGIVGVGTEVIELLPREPVEVALPGGALRALGVVATGAFTTTDPWARLQVVLRDADGGVLLDTHRRLFGGGAEGSVLAAVPETTAAQAASATITLLSDEPIPVRGVGGVPAVVVVRPADDGLRVVDVGGATVYERLTALPRIRWADSAVVETDEQAALDLVSSGPAPDVVLSEPGPVASGAPSRVDLIEDSGDVIEVVLDAEGDGYLVVADGLQDRWTATVDGAPAELRAADVGVVAVAVPAGEHVVRLEYTQPAGATGYLLSGASGAILVGLVLLDRRRWRLRAHDPADAISAKDSGPPARHGADAWPA